MFARSSYSRAMPIDPRMIERRLRTLEERLERSLQHSGERLAGPIGGAAESIRDNIASALNALAAQVRSGATSVGYEAGKLGGEAAKLGNVALRRVATEVERRPLTMLAAAVGVGILLGLASQRRGW